MELTQRSPVVRGGLLPAECRASLNRRNSPPEQQVDYRVVLNHQKTAAATPQKTSAPWLEQSAPRSGSPMPRSRWALLSFFALSPPGSEGYRQAVQCGQAEAGGRSGSGSKRERVNMQSDLVPVHAKCGGIMQIGGCRR